MDKRTSVHAIRRHGLQIVMLAALIVASAGLMILYPDFVSEFQTWLQTDRNYALTLIGLLLCFVLIQILLLPSGTAILLITGALLGPVSGGLYFAAMLMATPGLYWLAKSHPDHAQSTLRPWVDSPSLGPLLERGFSGIQSKPILATGMFRLLPVMPSAPAVLIAAALGLTLRGVLLGTLLFGGIRPMVIAIIGYSIGQMALSSSGSLDQAIIWTLLAAFGSLTASLGLLYHLVKSSTPL